MHSAIPIAVYNNTLTIFFKKIRTTTLQLKTTNHIATFAQLRSRYWSSWELFSDQYLQFCQLTAPNKWKCTWCEEINSSYTFRSITWLKFLRTSSVFNKMFTRSSHGVHLHKMACCLLFMDMPPTLFCHYRLHSGSKINEGLNAVSYLYATRSGSRWWIL